MLYGYDEWTDISARYGMPMCVYYHCDFTAQDDTEAIASIEQVQAFREKFGYSFVMEKQMASACAMALQNVLGLVCDPVAGLVEVPCVKRNVIGAVNAISAVSYTI